VTLNTRVADSVILASFTVCLALSSLLLFLTSYAIVIIAVWYMLLPVLLIATLFFGTRDFRRGLRRQAKIAALISLPVLLFVIYLLGFTRLDL
jgi:cation transport ATPase